MVDRAAALHSHMAGMPEALDNLRSALKDTPNDSGLLIAEAEALVDREDNAALERIEFVLSRAPEWVEGHVAVARLRWQQGRHDDHLALIEGSLRHRRNNPRLWVRYMALLMQSGEQAKAADVAASLQRRMGANADLALLEARYAGLAGQNERASNILQRITINIENGGIEGGVPGLELEKGRHALRRNDPEQAVEHLDAARAQDPSSMASWGLSEITWRVLGDARHQWLLDPNLFLQQIDLGLSGAFLEQLADRLRTIQMPGSAPLGQTIRNGSQSRGHLQKREEEELVAVFDVLQKAVEQYWQGLPMVDEAHPLLCHRNHIPVISTAWSIRILGKGHLVSHIHDHGVLSSACHIVVPEMDEHHITGQGVLELGRPPEDIAIDLPPVASIQPQLGHLVLFPAYMYHGTAQLHDGERITIAFDAV